MPKSTLSYIEKDDFHRLQIIAENLSIKYPKDWYSKFWEGANIYVFVGSILIGMIISASSAPLWMAFIPFLGAMIIFNFLPSLLWKRKKFAPRWAHPNASLSPEEVDEIELIAHRLKPVQRVFVSKQLPAVSGDKFWIIWLAAKEYAAGEAHSISEYQIGWKDWIICISSLIMSSIVCFLMSQIVASFFGINFAQWALSHFENAYVKAVIQFFTLPIFR